jgi:hypothetical protein
MQAAAKTFSEVNMAQDYAERIAERVAQVEEILSSDDWKGVSAEALELAKDYGYEPGEDVSPFEVATAWLNDVLEIRKTVSLTTNDVTGYEILITFGGPNCWAYFDGSDYATVRAWWGSEKGERQVYAHELGEYIFSTLEA